MAHWLMIVNVMTSEMVVVARAVVDWFKSTKWEDGKLLNKQSILSERKRPLKGFKQEENSSLCAPRIPVVLKGFLPIGKRIIYYSYSSRVVLKSQNDSHMSIRSIHQT